MVGVINATVKVKIDGIDFLINVCEEEDIDSVSTPISKERELRRTKDVDFISGCSAHSLVSVSPTQIHKPCEVFAGKHASGDSIMCSPNIVPESPLVASVSDRDSPRSPLEHLHLDTRSSNDYLSDSDHSVSLEEDEPLNGFVERVKTSKSRKKSLKCKSIKLMWGNCGGGKFLQHSNRIVPKAKKKVSNHTVQLQGSKRANKCKEIRWVGDNGLEFQGLRDGSEHDESLIITDGTTRRMNAKVRSVEAAWNVGKKLGLNYVGDELELLKKWREEEGRDVLEAAT